MMPMFMYTYLQLVRLSLSGNSLSVLSADAMAACCTNLNKLDLSDNAIATIQNDSFQG
jgi:Leucine-rich repeat (LRR) protein